MRDVALEIERGTRQLSSEHGRYLWIGNWFFAVSQIKLLLCASDLKTLKTDPSLVEVEEFSNT